MLRNNKWLNFGFIILLSLTPILWFIGKHGVLINGVDTNFPLAPALWFARRMFVWQSIVNLGSDFSAGSAGLFFHLIQLIPFKLGLSLQIAEIISLVFWFTLVTLSSWILARILFVNKKLPQIIFVVLYTLNIYMFNTWENVKVANLSLIVTIPLAISILLLLKQKKLSRSTGALMTFIVGIIFSGAGINPAYIISFFGILTIFLFGQILNDIKNKNEILESLKDFLLLSIVIILANLFWILPTTNFIFSSITSSNSIGAIGFSNWIDSLSQNTSLVNVIRMLGAWDWYVFDGASKLPVYIPYAAKYFFNPFFVGFSFLVPSVAFASFLIRKKITNFLYVTFGIMLFLGIFLTAGTHPPTGIVFSFLARHVPFFSLFRSPWYIFAPFVGLSIAGLCGLFFSEIEDRFERIKVIKIAEVVFIIFALIYAYPILLGKVFRPNFNGSFYINFPNYVFDTRDYLANTPARERILSYPDDNIEKFNWGYSGVDSILALMSDREVVDAPLNDIDSPFAHTIGELFSSLKKDEITKAINLSDKFGIGQIFYKQDEVSLAPLLPDVITKNVSANFGKWSFYNFPSDSLPTPKIYSTNCCMLSYPYSDSYKNLGVISRNTQLANPRDSIFKNTDLISNTGSIVHAENVQLEDFNNKNSELNFKARDLGNVKFNFEIHEDGQYVPTLQKYKLADFGISGNNISLIFDGKNEVWNVNHVDDSYIYFDTINILSGQHNIVIPVVNKNLVDINSFKEIGEANFQFLNNIFSIVNRSKSDAYFDFPIKDFDPHQYYLVNLTYKQDYGNHAQVYFNQRSDTTLFKQETKSLPDYSDWGDYSFYYSTVETDSNLNIALEGAQSTEALGTKIEYKNFSVNKVFGNDLFFVKDIIHISDLPSVNFKEESPVSYDGEVNASTNSHVIVFNENYSPQWKMTILDNPKAKISHFTINTFANAWYVENVNGSYKFTIKYEPQNLFNAGYVLTSVSFVVVLLYFVFQKVKNAKNK
ncbi:hypothetical protein BH10PAT1_BH10PAT1_2970 [soil metagenome]